MANVIIFGAGDGGGQAYERLRGKANVVAFADNDPKKHGKTMFGVPVIRPEGISFLDYEYIVIGSTFIDEIKAQLVSLGVEEGAVMTNIAASCGTSDACSLKQDVAYAIETASVMARTFMEHGFPVAGKKVLEIGPGRNLGLALVLAAHGADVTVVDRFPVRWNGIYHPRFYRLLRDEMARQGLRLHDLDRVVEQDSIPETGLECVSLIDSSLEELDGTEIFDLTLSNAVFEHFYDHRQAMASLFKLTTPGGAGLHQVDYRYHWAFERPLDHLLYSKQEYKEIFERTNGGCGTQLRPLEMERIIRNAGFEIVRKDINAQAETEYLNDVVSRIGASTDSPYRGWSHHDLKDISAMYFLIKPLG